MRYSAKYFTELLTKTLIILYSQQGVALQMQNTTTYAQRHNQIYSNSQQQNVNNVSKQDIQTCNGENKRGTALERSLIIRPKPNNEWGV